MKYQDVYRELQSGVCIITFLKKDATIRNMLATRNTRIASIYGQFDARQFDGHDKRCNMDNGNIAVYDLIIDETRSFNIGRLISIKPLGDMHTRQEIDSAAEKFKQFDAEYKKLNPMSLDMSTKMDGVV